MFLFLSLLLETLLIVFGGNLYGPMLSIERNHENAQISILHLDGIVKDGRFLTGRNMHNHGSFSNRGAYCVGSRGSLFGGWDCALGVVVAIVVVVLVHPTGGHGPQVCQGSCTCRDGSVCGGCWVNTLVMK